MSGRGDEVEAAVDTSVRDAFLPGDVHLLLQELLVLLVDVLLNGLPAGGGGKRAGGGPEGHDREPLSPGSGGRLSPPSHSLPPEGSR